MTRCRSAPLREDHPDVRAPFLRARVRSRRSIALDVAPKLASARAQGNTAGEAEASPKPDSMNG
jgi:hypothetical protein